MFEFTVILPLRDNDKVSLSVEREHIHEQVLDVAGGYSSHEQRGAWRDSDGTVYYDTSESLTTLVDSQEALDTLKSASVTWCESMRQEALLITWREVNALFIEKTSATIAA